MLAKAEKAIGDERIKIFDVVIAATGAGEEVNKQAVIARTLFDPTLRMGDASSMPSRTVSARP